MPSKMVIDRQRSSEVVEQAAETFGPLAAEKLIPLLAAGLGPDEQPPDLAQTTRLLGLALERSRLRLIDSDVAHDIGRRVDREARALRDRTADELQGRLRDVRRFLEATYGEGTASFLVALDEPVRRDPIVLLRMAGDVLREVQRPTSARATEAPPLLPGVAVDRSTWVELIETPRAALRATLDEVTAAQRRLTATFAAKSEAIAAYDATFLQVSRVLESLFEAAGMPIVAARVRPSSRRPGQTDAEVEGPGEEPSEPPGATVPAAPTPTSDPPAVS